MVLHPRLARAAGARQDGGVISVVLIVVVLVVVVPIGVLISGAALSAVLGWLLKGDVDAHYEGTEYVDLGR
jgi:hypothetical protein